MTYTSVSVRWVLCFERKQDPRYCIYGGIERETCGSGE
jgi:hypothetical protein